MAETVFSMAVSTLGSAISKAAVAAAAEKMTLLMGVQKEIWFMKDELKTMQAFLIAAEAMKKKKPLVKVWAEQVRSLSYDIEDCLDEFMVHVRSRSFSQKLMKLKHRHRIAAQIRNLKSRVEEVSSRNTRYNLIETEATHAAADEAPSYMEDVRSHSARNIDEAQLEGIPTLKNKLLDMINTQDSDGHARAICVVGMGGLGKTTLVRKIYESKEGIENEFPYRAWITVSQSFSRVELLKDMIKKLLGDDSLKSCLNSHDGKAVPVQVDHLSEHLRKGLMKKRYFVVLDDLWSTDAWIWIRDICLPSDNNEASRIVITSRDASVAEDCTTKQLIFELKPLEKEHSIALLLRKMRKSKQDMENDEKLKTIVAKLVTKCGGLPLAIVTIGALFASKHMSEWDKLCAQLPSELENNLSLEAIRSMVSLSYCHLPSHLKPCFLYLSIFPEDFEIKRNYLVHKWIAEGLVRARVGMTLEDVGKGYFNELISRSMIQPSRVNLEGVVKRCRVHDIIRDIIVSLSREEGFVYISGDNIHSLVEDDFRHVAYHGNKCSTVGMDLSRVRSLTAFGERPTKHGLLLCSPKLRMLRALDLGNADFQVTQKDISNIGLLRHLKYVNIRFSNIYALPRSIGNLKGLQVLDIRDSYISTLPTEICKLQSLRIIRCRKKKFVFGQGELLMASLCLPMEMLIHSIDSEARSETIAQLHMAFSSCSSPTRAVKVPRGVGNLKELHILDDVDIKRTSRKAIEELGELGKLRKLKVNTEGATEKKCITICKVIQKLCSLDSLEIHDFGGTIEWADSISSPPSLSSITLVGRIGNKFEWFQKLRNLVKIRMWFNEIKERKAIDILEALPNLRLLGLGHGAYTGTEFVFKQGTFLNLRYLDLVCMNKLEEIRFEQDASPQMETIQILGYRSGKPAIYGINHLPKLKEISMEGIKDRRGMLQEEVNTHCNQPVLRLL